jgi:hypothetical protein
MSSDWPLDPHAETVASNEIRQAILAVRSFMEVGTINVPSSPQEEYLLIQIRHSHDWIFPCNRTGFTATDYAISGLFLLFGKWFGSIRAIFLLDLHEPRAVLTSPGWSGLALSGPESCQKTR